MSSRELARRAEISQAYLSQLETGRNNNPTPIMIQNIAKGLGVSFVDLWRIVFNTKEVDSPLINATHANEQVDRLKRDIVNQLQSLTNEEGCFYDLLKADMFKVINSNQYIVMAFNNTSDLKKYYEFFVTYFSSPPERYLKSEHNEAMEMFDKAYGIETIHKAINSNNITLDELKSFRSSLENIIEKHNLKKDYSLTYKEVSTDLGAILEKDTIVYNNHLLTKKEKQLLKSYLEALFSD